jgi:hypothetical protein
MDRHVRAVAVASVNGDVEEEVPDGEEVRCAHGREDRRAPNVSKSPDAL